MKKMLSLLVSLILLAGTLGFTAVSANTEYVIPGLEWAGVQVILNHAPTGWATTIVDGEEIIFVQHPELIHETMVSLIHNGQAPDSGSIAIELQRRNITPIRRAFLTSDGNWEVTQRVGAGGSLSSSWMPEWNALSVLDFGPAFERGEALSLVIAHKEGNLSRDNWDWSAQTIRRTRIIFTGGIPQYPGTSTLANVTVGTPPTSAERFTVATQPPANSGNNNTPTPSGEWRSPYPFGWGLVQFVTSVQPLDWRIAYDHNDTVWHGHPIRLDVLVDAPIGQFGFDLVPGSQRDGWVSAGANNQMIWDADENGSNWRMEFRAGGSGGGAPINLLWFTLGQQTGDDQRDMILFKEIRVWNTEGGTMFQDGRLPPLNGEIIAQMHNDEFVADVPDTISVVLNGNPVVFDVPPQIIDNRTMVPLRAIFEAMGANVDWNGDTQTVTAARGGTTVVMQVGNNVITVNGNAITLDVPPMIVDNRTLVPVRAVAESFGADVEWRPTTQTVFITAAPVAPPPVTTTASEFELEVFRLVNVERANHGLPALIWHDELATVARAHSADMAHRNFFDHTNPDGVGFGARITNAGITSFARAENIAIGIRAAETVMSRWMDSPMHRANILSPSLTHLGVGHYADGNYWTQKFIGI